MFGETLRTLRSAVRRARRVLLAMRVEAQRSGASAGDHTITAIECAKPRNRAPAKRRSRGSRLSATKPDGRRSLIAIETDSPGEGLVAARDYSELTLSSIRRAMQEIESKGYQPDGIILRTSEAKIMLKHNFAWEEGDPLPENIHLFGLPVKVQD